MCCVFLATPSAFSLTSAPISSSVLITAPYWSSAVMIAAIPVLTSPVARSIASSAFFE